MIAAPIGLDLRSEICGFQFPLNIYGELLRLETGTVDYLHYGLFEPGERDVARAQRRHTEEILKRLPPPPSSILDVGIGMGTTLAELFALGYDAAGLTPDSAQIAIAHRRIPSATLFATSFEAFLPERRYDLVLFQESSQYIDADTLFSQARRCCTSNGQVLISDEFSVGAVGGLQSLDYVLSSAGRYGFRLLEKAELTPQAAATVDYLLDAVERRRQELEANLGLGPDVIDTLHASNLHYKRQYGAGHFQYHCLRFLSPH